VLVAATVDVPVIAPVLAFKLRPVGKLPVVTLYTILSPVATTVVLYGAEVDPPGNAPPAVTHTGMALYVIPAGLAPFVPSVLYTYNT
jgi:hypothetical protein